MRCLIRIWNVAGTGFGVQYLAVIGRSLHLHENRSMALGVATASGSAGQISWSTNCRHSLA